MKPPLTEADIAWVQGMVLYEDDQIVVLNKPAGLSSQAGRVQGNTLDDLLVAFARSNGNRPRLIHRLDRDTSGVILTGRTKPAAGFLGKAIMGHRMTKTYLAIVTPGAPDPKGGVIVAPLRREEIGREAYMRVCEEGHRDAEASQTRYRTLAVGQGAALVECSPTTGRMHQIRVHLGSIDRPIAGDSRYGGALMLNGEPVARLMLHASSLDFPHPEGGRRKIIAPPPEDFLRCLAAAGLEQSALALHST